MLGTETQICARSLSGPAAPVRATVAIPSACAASNARSMLGDAPLVLMPSSTSAGLPSACTWRAKMSSNLKSLTKPVRNELSVVSASAGRAGLTKPAVSRLVNSAARCWQSAALPPLPHSSSLPPARMQSVIFCAAAAIDGAHCVAVARRNSAPACKWVAMISAGMHLYL